MTPEQQLQLKTLCAVGTPALIMDLVMHGGWPGVVAGGAAALIAAKNAPDIADVCKDFFPMLPVGIRMNNGGGSERTFWDRAWGRFPSESEYEERNLARIVREAECEAVELDRQWDNMAQRGQSEENDTLPQPKMQRPLAPSSTPVVPPVFSVYPGRVTLRLGQAIDKEALTALSAAYASGKRITVSGKRFDPHFNGLIGKGWVAAANQGFGKSILNGVIIEQGGACGLPIIVLDHKGEYDTVKELPFMNALIAGRSGNVDFALSPENADEFVELVMTQRHQAIVLLPTYGSGWLGKATISAAVGRALMRYAEKQRQLEQKLLPCLVIMDEAQLYLPQDQTLLPPEALENKSTLSDLKNAYFALVSNGRSAGFTMGFATQSLTYLAKWVIKSSQVRIFGRHAEKNDLDMCEQIINPAVATRGQIEVFPPGVGVVFGFTPLPMVVQFDRKQSRDASETPGIELLEQATPARVSMPAIALRDGDTTPSVATGEETLKRSVAGVPKLLRSAYDAYAPGMTYRELGVKLGCGDGDARLIWQELKKRGMLHGATGRNVTAVTVAPQSPFASSEEPYTVTRYGRNDELESAPERATEAAVSTVRPEEWNEEREQTLTLLYQINNNIDKCLTGLNLSTSQRNRDYARELLKREGMR